MKTLAKLFPTDFVSEHKKYNGAVAYRFSFRVKDSDGEFEKNVRVSYRVGSPADIQAYADMLAQDDRVVNAACEYLYSVDLDKLAKITPIKSLNDVAEEVL